MASKLKKDPRTKPHFAHFFLGFLISVFLQLLLLKFGVSLETAFVINFILLGPVIAYHYLQRLKVYDREGFEGYWRYGFDSRFLWGCTGWATGFFLVVVASAEAL